MNVKEIKELVKLLVETDITELNLESEGTKIVIKKGQTGGVVLPMLGVNSPVPAPQTPPISPAPSLQPAGVEQATMETEEAELKIAENQMMIAAPMVGTFYRAPSPDADPFVQVGQVVEAGEVLCIIEAMKLMNEIESDTGGKIVQILVENGQPVEYGQPMFVLEKV